MARAKRGAAAGGSRQSKRRPSPTDTESQCSKPKRRSKSPSTPVVEREKRDLSAVGKMLSKMDALAAVERDRIKRQKMKEYRQRARKFARERKEEEARRQAAKAKNNGYESDLSDEEMHRTVKQELFDDEPEASQQPGQSVPASGLPFSFFELDSVMNEAVSVKQEIVEKTNEHEETSTSVEAIVIIPVEESSVHATDGEQPTTDESAMDESTGTAANALVELQSPVSTLAQRSATPLLATPAHPMVTPVAEEENTANFFDTAVLQQANAQQKNTEGAPLERSEQDRAAKTASTQPVKLMFKPRSVLAGTPKRTSFTETRGAFDIVDSEASAVDAQKATAAPLSHHDEPAPSDAESDKKSKSGQRIDKEDAQQASAGGEPAETTTAIPDASEVSSPVGPPLRVDAINLGVTRRQLDVLSEHIHDIEYLKLDLQRVLSDVEGEFSNQTIALLRELSGRAGTRVDSTDIRRPAEKRLSSILTDVKKKLNSARCMADSVTRTLADLGDGLRDAWNSLSEKDRRSHRSSLVELVKENMRLEAALKLLEQSPVSKQKADLFAGLDRMSERFDECQQAVREGRRKLADKEDRLEKKRRSVKDLEADNARLKADAATMSRKLEQAEAGAQAQALVNRNLNTNLNKMSTEWDQRHQQLTAAMLKANGEKETVEKRSVELQRQLDAAEKTIYWYRDGVGKLQAQLDESNDSLKTTERQFAEKSINCQALGEQVEELQRQLAAIKTEAERELEVEQRLRGTVKELEAQLRAKDVRIAKLENGATANALQKPQPTSELEKRMDQPAVDLEKTLADKGAAEELANQRLMQLVEAQVTTTQQKEQIDELQEQLKKALETSKETENRLAGMTYKYTALKERLDAQRVCTEDRMNVLRTDMEKDKQEAVELAAQRLLQLEESQRNVELQEVKIRNLQAQVDKQKPQPTDKPAWRLLETQYLLKQEKLRASVAEERAENLSTSMVKLYLELKDKDSEISRQPGGKSDEQKCKALESQIEELRAELGAAREEAMKVPDLSVKILLCLSQLQLANTDLNAAQEEALKVPALQVKIDELESQLQRANANLDAAREEALKVHALQVKIDELESQLQRANANLDAAREEALKVPAFQATTAELRSQLKLALDDVDARKALINRLTSVISRGIIRPRMLEQQRKRELAKSRELVAILQSQLDAADAKKAQADDVESHRAKLVESETKLTEALAEVERLKRAKGHLHSISEHFKSLYLEAEGKPRSEIDGHAPPSKKPRKE